MAQYLLIIGYICKSVVHFHYKVSDMCTIMIKTFLAKILKMRRFCASNVNTQAAAATKFVDTTCHYL